MDESLKKRTNDWNSLSMYATLLTNPEANVSDVDLASIPHKKEVYTIKTIKFLNLGYYFFGLLALMYFFKKQGQTFKIILAQ